MGVGGFLWSKKTTWVTFSKIGVCGFGGHGATHGGVVPHVYPCKSITSVNIREKFCQKSLEGSEILAIEDGGSSIYLNVYENVLMGQVQGQGKKVRKNWKK